MDFSSNIASQLNAGAILPEGIVIITLMLVLVIDLILGRDSARWLPYLAIAGLLAAVVDLGLICDSLNTDAFLGSFFWGL
jgi:NAD(P)H-quinone oxidoreductase subunit 2